MRYSTPARSGGRFLGGLTLVACLFGTTSRAMAQG
jgi:hypothetical protein